MRHLLAFSVATAIIGVAELIGVALGPDDPGLLALAIAHAEPASVLPGYTCLQLALTPETAPAFAVPVPPHAADALPDVLAAPSADAPRIGKVGALVAVRSPGPTTAGYVQTLLLNGRPGWVRADALQPYHAVSAPHARCAVVTRPGGYIGFFTWTPGR